MCADLSLFKGQCQVQVLWSALLQTHQGTNEEMKVVALIDGDFSVMWDLLPEPCVLAAVVLHMHQAVLTARRAQAHVSGVCSYAECVVLGFC